MENEEKEDLLVDVAESEDESSEKEEIDCYIKEKIIDFIHREREIPKTKKQVSVIVACLLVFLASSTLVIVVPIYLKHTTASNISTYNKLVTVSFGTVLLFLVAHAVKLISKLGCQPSPDYSLSLLDVFKVSLLLSVGSITIFWLIDGSYVRCHLVDPLKGSAVVFSLIFYYVFSKKRMNLERTFCAITIIVGIFVSIDFGICDKFHCNGVSNVSDVTPKLHVLYVLLCLLAHALWVLHLTFIEVSLTASQELYSTQQPPILRNMFGNSGNLKQPIQSLSIICQDEAEEEMILKNDNSDQAKCIKHSLTNSKCHSRNRIVPSKLFDNSLVNSMAFLSQVSLCDMRKFPITSTPKNELNECQSFSAGRVHDVSLWQHGKEKLLVEVMSEVRDSFRCHFGWSSDTSCSSLPITTGVFIVSYVTLILSSLELLKRVQSTVTVVSIMMPALPVSSLFWCLFQMNGNSKDVLDFSPQITGEAVCAVLGLPIIGIGIVLLLKSHFKEFNLVI
ncbi:hypothetical protein RUM44_001652 [Polyplax serrata]|uniref:EamA domain-containing protein n=1 Tax=Polyplax serrata TaxID=468196 RepID=A0ABR1AKP7_POLSC